MTITKLNYEKYVIDYMEGQLDAATRKEFNNFLQVNPDVREEIQLFLSSPLLEPELVVMPQKKKLYKRPLFGIRTLSTLLLLFIAVPSIWYASDQYLKDQRITEETELLQTERLRKTAISSELSDSSKDVNKSELPELTVIGNSKLKQQTTTNTSTDNSQNIRSKNNSQKEIKNAGKTKVIKASQDRASYIPIDELKKIAQSKVNRQERTSCFYRGKSKQSKRSETRSSS